MKPPGHGAVVAMNKKKAHRGTRNGEKQKGCCDGIPRSTSWTERLLKGGKGTAQRRNRLMLDHPNRLTKRLAPPKGGNHAGSVSCTNRVSPGRCQ